MKRYHVILTERTVNEPTQCEIRTDSAREALDFIDRHNHPGLALCLYTTVQEQAAVELLSRQTFVESEESRVAVG